MNTGKSSGFRFCFKINGEEVEKEIKFTDIQFQLDNDSFTATYSKDDFSFSFDCWADLRRFNFWIAHNDRFFRGDLSFGYIEEPMDAEEERRVLEKTWILQREVFFARPDHAFPEFVYF